MRRIALLLTACLALPVHAQVDDIDRNGAGGSGGSEPSSVSWTQTQLYSSWWLECHGLSRSLTFFLPDAPPDQCDGLGGDVTVYAQGVDQAVAPQDHLGAQGLQNFYDMFAQVVTHGGDGYALYGYGYERIATLTAASQPGYWIYTADTLTGVNVDYPDVVFTADDVNDCREGLALALLGPSPADAGTPPIDSTCGQECSP